MVLCRTLQPASLPTVLQKILVNHLGQPVKLFYQNWDQGAVEQEIYRLLHEARTAALAAQGRQ